MEYGWYIKNIKKNHTISSPSLLLGQNLTSTPHDRMFTFNVISKSVLKTCCRERYVILTNKHQLLFVNAVLLN